MYESLQMRWAPERVVQEILDRYGAEFPARDRRRLQALCGGHRSLMSDRFAGVDDLSRQLRVAEELFRVPAPLASDAQAVSEYVEHLRSLLGAGEGDFKAGRLSRQDRVAAGKIPGHRAYNKRFRLLERMAGKVARCASTGVMRYLAQVAKSALALEVRAEDFWADGPTACFVAYYAAALNRRSVFTNQSQDRAFDEVAELLYGRLGQGAGWFAVAHVYPTPEVVGRLTQEQQGQLLGRWYGVMVRAARVLEVEARSGLDLEDLVVRRGNDSSTWNEAAGAFNKAREGWMNTLHATGAAEVLDRHLPGKALRLMAADVVRWHRMSGKGLDPDTQVWRELPRPWDVVLGTATCTRSDIQAACERAGMQGRGWVGPREKGVAAFRPTPELVHGVTVASPELGAALRRAGWYAGPSKG